MTTEQRPMTRSSVNSIMKKRIAIPTDAVGHKVKFTIDGNGNVQDVKNKAGELVISTIAGYEGTVLQKKIFNLKAYWTSALTNERNRQFLKDAILAEKAGDTQKASELYRQFLNATQMSFGILLPSSVADRLAKGVEISATVEKVTTENGSLLTIDASTISIIEPKVYGTTSFDSDDIDAEILAEEEAAAAAASTKPLTAAEKKAAAAAKAAATAGK